MQVTAAMVKELREMTGAGMSACKNALVEANGDVKRANEILREKGLAAAAKKAGRVAAEGLVMAAVSPDRKKGALVEVNSETDFVAKNDEFITFVQNMAKQALESSAETPEALLEEKWVADSSQTAKDALTNKIATIGENLGLRRFARFNATDGSAVVEYIHGGGRIGAMLLLSAPEINDAVLEAGRNVCMQIASMSPQFLSRDDVPAEHLKNERDFLLKQALDENKTAAKPKPENIITNMVEGRLSKSMKEICLLDQEYVKDGEFTVASYLKSVHPDLKITSFTRYEKGEGIEKKETDFAAEVAEAMKG
ncbi:MAG: translation elongation factor Ts [Defluviitaleaceae bacterium]|nr:translation elongation factor Ts [Defluviitaleaceae bacterium]MCL2264334.1 translation elongation factor Ts [Defluviitaleaceae bacterium]